MWPPNGGNLKSFTTKSKIRVNAGLHQRKCVPLWFVLCDSAILCESKLDWRQYLVKQCQKSNTHLVKRIQWITMAWSYVMISKILLHVLWHFFFLNVKFLFKGLPFFMNVYHIVAFIPSQDRGETQLSNPRSWVQVFQCWIPVAKKSLHSFRRLLVMHRGS